MRIIKKDQVLKIVAGWISREWMYTCPPNVTMLNDCSIILTEDLEKEQNAIINPIDNQICLIEDIKGTLIAIEHSKKPISETVFELCEKLDDLKEKININVPIKKIIE